MRINETVNDLWDNCVYHNYLFQAMRNVTRMSQAKFAYYSGATQNAISRFERGLGIRNDDLLIVSMDSEFKSYLKKVPEIQRWVALTDVLSRYILKCPTSPDIPKLYCLLDTYNTSLMKAVRKAKVVE